MCASSLKNLWLTAEKGIDSFWKDKREWFVFLEVDDGSSQCLTGCQDIVQNLFHIKTNKDARRLCMRIYWNFHSRKNRPKCFVISVFLVLAFILLKLL